MGLFSRFAFIWFDPDLNSLWYWLPLIHGCQGKSFPLVNPVLIAIALVIAVLWLLHISYQDYLAGGQFIHFLLEPATVGLVYWSSPT